MSERVTYSFSDVAEFKKGINYSSTDYVEGNTGIPFISIKCLLKGGGFDFTGIKFLKDRFDNSDKLKTGELLFSITDLTRTGDIVGSPLLVPEKYNESVASMDLIRVKPNEFLLNTEYLYYLMMTNKVRNYFVNHSAGSTVLHLEIAAIPKLIINLPLLTQQRKIARILSTADAVIEKTEAAIAKYKAIKQGMLHDLFTRGIDINTGKLRPKYEDAPELYKESKLGTVPQEWDVAEIGNIIHIKHGYSFEGKYFSNEKSEYILLTPGNFNVDGNLYFQDRNTKYFVGEIPNDFVFNNGDLLIVMTDLTQDMNILGNVVKMNSPYKVLHNQRIGKIELLKHDLNKDYLLFILNTPFSKNNIKKTATGTTVRHTSPNHIYKGIIPIPNIAEQNKIAERLLTIDHKLNTEQTYLHKLQAIKQGLMNDLLIGKKRVKVPEKAEMMNA